MSWNYRVVEHETYNEIYEGKVIEYQIHEVYYDEHGENQWMTRELALPTGILQPIWPKTSDSCNRHLKDLY